MIFDRKEIFDRASWGLKNRAISQGAVGTAELRDPPAILFISHDTWHIDSIAKLFRACFFLFYGVSHNYRAIRCKKGYGKDVHVETNLKWQGGISHDMGYRSDTIAISRDVRKRADDYFESTVSEERTD